MSQSSNPNLNVVRLRQFFANLKSNGFSDSFGFRFSFRFVKPKFIICRNPPLATQSKQIHTK